MSNIRNFCIIAHVDHGKSTLADRFLELTGTVEQRKMKEQFLDQMPLEREKGITIKMQPVRMVYREFILNLIDTPGHADFSYEVSRSLAAVEGAILLVDATKGVQAQTLAHLHHAKEQGLVIVPAVNKIDSPLARTEEVAKEIASLLQIGDSEIVRISAKEGTRVQELLNAVIQRVPAPQGETAKPLRALIFDSVYDSFRGIIAHVRVMEGRIQGGEKISFCATGAQGQVKEVGYFVPQQHVGPFLSAGEIGYVATGLKDPKDVRIGDTIVKSEIRNSKSELALPGFTIPKPMVFASFYPQDVDDFDILKTALSQLQLNDPSFVFEQESKEALGRGFRCGFLGVLHSEIIAERVQREFHIEMVVSRPSVEFHVLDKAGKERAVRTPPDWPDANTVAWVKEPMCKLEVMCPVDSFSSISQLLLQHEGIQLSVTDLVQNRLLLAYRIPLREIVANLHDHLKSASQGLASMDYEVQDWEKADVVKMAIHVAGKNEEALSVIVPRSKAYKEGKVMLEKLKDSLPSQQFEVALQAFVEGRVIARETMKAQRRDVTAPLYGGDVTRKRKLLEIQKKGKKELKAKGRVIIPTRVFLDLFRS